MDLSVAGSVLLGLLLGVSCLVGSGVVLVVVLALLAAAGQRRRAALERFAAALEEGRASGDDLSLQTAQGRLEGRALWLDLAGGRQTLAVEVPHAAGDLELTRLGGLEGLLRGLGLGPESDEGWGITVRQGSSQTAFRQHEASRQALLALFERGRSVEVRLQGGWLRVSRRSRQAEPEELLGWARCLLALARQLERRPVQVRVLGAAQALAWAGGGEQPRCPYCRDDLDPEAPDVSACPSCRTLHHAACLEEAGGCTVFACRGRPGQRMRG